MATPPHGREAVTALGLFLFAGCGTPADEMSQDLFPGTWTRFGRETEFTDILTLRPDGTYTRRITQPDWDMVTDGHWWMREAVKDTSGGRLDLCALIVLDSLREVETRGGVTKERDWTGTPPRAFGRFTMDLRDHNRIESRHAGLPGEPEKRWEWQRVGGASR